jgi:hypothetical protein
MVGGAGADTSLIGAMTTGNVRVLADSASGTDSIRLTSTTSNVGTSLDASEIVIGTASTTADHRLIYDAGPEQPFYDDDGNASGAAVLFAMVVPGMAINMASFDMMVPTATAG